MENLTNDDKKEINEHLDYLAELETFDGKKLKVYLEKWSNYKFTPQILGKIYLLVNPPDEDGFSADITISELTEYHPSFRTSNGGDWCRSDNSFLGQKYIIKRSREGGRIHSVKLDGINKGLKINQNIRADIVAHVSKQNCAILDISKDIEVDHKNGKKDEHHMNDMSKQSLSDFQPLSKAANDAKRTHCTRCKQTGKRYDAKRLGYSESFTKGDFDTDNCQGCYWYDPQKFNKEISASFKKTK